MDLVLKLLIIEDEEQTRNEYVKSIEKFDNLTLLCATDSTKVAIEKIKEVCPDAIILDLELHNGYGNGLSFLKELNKLDIEKRPYILVATNNISQITHDMVRKSGADFLMTKTQKDYSAKMPLSFLSSLAPDILSGSQASERLNTELDNKLEVLIDKELDSIGISHKMKGRVYLKEGIKLAYHKKQKNITKKIAEIFDKTDSSVERAMQSAINHAWHITDVDSLEKHYTAYINPNKGIPTLTEFVYYYAENLKKSI
jgi:CheY-like chemotaxis protein